MRGGVKRSHLHSNLFSGKGKMDYDLVISNGHIIDPQNGIDAVRDLAIKDGRIAAVGQVNADEAVQRIDATGLYLTPGLVDIHMHAYATPGHRDAWAGDNSILPDGFSFRTGVTTMVDTGSAGWRNFGDFRERVIDRCQTRLFALINISGTGMTDTDHEQNPYDMDTDQAAGAAREHADVVIGIKTAHYYGPEWISVDRCLEAAEKAGMPVMIDFGFFKRERPYYELLTDKLRPGDISTHVFRGPTPWFDAEGKVLPYLHQARERGVILDVGHGAGSFCFRNAVPAVAQGFYPDSISTDLHVLCMNQGMLDMTTTMSKFLVLGMPLADVIRASTINPATEIGHPELGHLSVGAIADVALLDLRQGAFGYADSFGGKLAGDQRLFCEMTLKSGEVVWDLNGRAAVDYAELGPDYGIREGEYRVMPPGA
jgi:dihydroorotase